MNIPVTEIKMQEFDLAVFETEVAAMTRKMPVFHWKDDRSFTKRLLVSVVAGVAKQQNVNSSNNEKYCKSCRIKHPAENIPRQVRSGMVKRSAVKG